METLSSINHYVASYFAALAGGEILILPIIVAIKISSTNFFGAMAAAFAGTLTRDWVVFLLFRKKGRQILIKKQKFKTKILRVEKLLNKHGTNVFCAYRLMFGLVNIVLMVLGISGLSFKKFAVLSLISNFIFIVMVGGFGYFFTELMIETVAWIHQNKIFGFGGFAILILFYLFVKKWKTFLVAKRIL
jgi:membrane protein DedA with SNARE-associated domain